ncbi:MAG: transketolase [Acidobacteria bacterium]|nr:transketolase [Acidobacteriota bacterium]
MPGDELVESLKTKALWVRQRTLGMACRAGDGHIASTFSCVEILVSLYFGGSLRFDPAAPDAPGRDRFILSKAQAAMALYAVLADLGFFPLDELDTFCLNGSRLGGHAESSTPGIEVVSGSLGHGLSLGCGIALAGKLDGASHQVFVLVGDGECHEGSVWESAMFAGHHKLSGLIAIIDNNELSASDRLDDYLTLEPFRQKWLAFGWETLSVDGHSIPALLAAFRYAKDASRERPLAIIARTVKGKGIRFMEGRPDWHYRIPVGDEVTRARRDLGLEEPEHPEEEAP